MLSKSFFNKDAQTVAKALLGKVIRVKCEDIWLFAMIIETEAYYKSEKASHSSLGYSEKRKALFMSPGTIYMYYARGGDSLNVSCRGSGNAVLIKSAIPYITESTDCEIVEIMQELNPLPWRQKRPVQKLCSGQTLLCRSLGLKVRDWDQRQFDLNHFYIEDVGCYPKKIIQTMRLGIPKGRDEELMYRFIYYDYASCCTSNPLCKKGSTINILNTV